MSRPTDADRSPEKKPNDIRVVMISSTARDLPLHREQVMSACLAQNLFPKMMEHLPASDANAIQASLRMVDEADLYIGIIGFRYGYVPRSRTKSITEMEYDRAGERKIPRLMFLMHEDHALRAADVETGAGASGLRAFRQRISEDRVIAMFTSPENLRGHVLLALGEFRATPQREELVTSQLNTAKYRIAILNQCKSIDAATVDKSVRALQKQIHLDLASTWGIDADLTLVPDGQTPPAKTWWVYLQEELEQDGVLAYHDVNAEGLPLGRVGVQTSTRAGMSWTVSASHTLLQLLANPKGTTMVADADRFIPQEICRPCAGERWAYQVDGVLVSDFVLPSWFEAFHAPKSTRFDYMGHVNEPFEVLPGGYVFYFEKAAQRSVWADAKRIRVGRSCAAASRARMPQPIAAKDHCRCKLQIKGEVGLINCLEDAWDTRSRPCQVVE